VDQGRWNLRGTEEQHQANGTSRDMPTGFRPCPFCHSVIPWGSETCPSCGRVLIERVAARPPTPSDSWSTTTRGTSWAVFRPASSPLRRWWPRGIPQPSDRERIIFLAAAAIMVALFLLLLFR